MPILGSNSSGGSRPSAPVIGSATDGGTGTTASVAFTPSTYIGKGTITYTATSSPGSITATSSSSPITVTGLTTGTAYTFTVQGTTNYGVTSEVSSASNSLTPITPSSFESIATSTPNGTQTVSFTSIPSTYKSLQLRISMVASGNNSTFIQFNGDTATNYSWHYLTAGRSASANVSSAGGSINSDVIALSGTAYASADATYPTVFIINIIDYASTAKNKTANAFLGINRNALSSNSELGLVGGTWRSTAAINRIDFYFNGGTTFNSGSNIALYGVK